MDRKPVLAVTMGDVAGVGPEIVAKALLAPSRSYPASFLVVGDARVLDRTCTQLRIKRRPKVWDGKTPLRSLPRGIHIHSLTDFDPRSIRMGKVDKRYGHASMQYVRVAAQWAIQGVVDGIVTAPLSKEAMHKAGYRFEGHTDYLAHLGGGKDVRMMFLGPAMNVILASIHIPLMRVAASLSAENLFETIRLGAGALMTMGKAHPRIAVCGLNPHGGEAGAFGKEERKMLRPAILAAQRQGWDVFGPVAADGFFATQAAEIKAHRKSVDLIVAMYHDQGLIPFKMLHFDCGVNTTLGLGYVRTSPDHGTAWDIAGEGIASAHSMVAAINQAIGMCKRQ